MDRSAIHARLEKLERVVQDLSRPPLFFESAGMEPEPSLMDLQRAHVFAGGATASATIEISGEIDQAMQRHIEAEIQAKRMARHLDIIIDSEGGEYWASMSIYRAIRWSPAYSKSVRMLSCCSSGAILVALAADTRIARPDTELVLHMVGTPPSPDKRWTAADHAEAMRQKNAMDRRMLSLIAERTGADFHDLAREASNEHPSALSWCLAHGLIDAIEDQRPGADN